MREKTRNWFPKILQWPVEIQISYEFCFLFGQSPGVGLSMLDRYCCGFASMYAGGALNVFVSAQECMENLSPSP